MRTNLVVSTTSMIIVLVVFFTTPTAGIHSGSANQVTDPKELGHLALPPNPTRSNDNWTDWETWEASPEISTAFPYYRSGYDNEGSVVYIVEFGKRNYRQLAFMLGEREEEFWMHLEKLGRCMEKDAATCNNQGTAIIGDWDCFGLKHYVSTAAMESALKTFVFITKLNRFTNYGFAVNMDFSAETFINIVRPLSENYLNKLDFYGTRSEKWRPKLLQKIPGSQLPPKYGGDKDWKPLRLNSPRVKACER